MPNNERLKPLARLSAGDWDKITVRAEELMGGHHFGCSEALVLAFQEKLGEGLLPQAAVSLASAFRGGFGGAGCTCGALCGGEMVLGAVFGYQGDAGGRQDPAEVAHARSLYKELHDRFREINRSSCCRVLTKDVTPGSPEAKAKCTRLVKIASALAGGIIAREACTAIECV